MNRQKFMKEHPIDFLSELEEINNASELVDSWTKIDSSRIGINFAIKINKLIYIYVDRVYSTDFYSLTEEEFNQWRKDIKKVR